MKIFELRKIIKEEIIREYMSRDMVSLKHYFSMSDEKKKSSLPHEYYYFLRDWMEEEDVELELPKNTFIGGDGEEFEDEMHDYEIAEWLEREHPDKAKQFAEYLFRKIENYELPINDADYPAWSFFDSEPEIVKNQWLIHFTKDAQSIALEGFKYGVDEMTKLGLTTHLGEFDKKYGGYNFAYLLKDFDKYGRSSGRGYGSQKYKYGKEAVIFRASGIKLWHHSDQEPQVIFYGNTANTIIPITAGEENNWAIASNKTGRILYESDELKKVIDWLVTNYNQYKNVLVYR